MAKFEGELFYDANGNTFENARLLRKESTPAEERLWSYLRNRKFHNLKFRRQHPIGNFVADFYCHDILLVIELDGDVHHLPEVRENDENRAYEIEKFGLTILRFTNDKVFHEIESVLKVLGDYYFSFSK